MCHTRRSGDDIEQMMDAVTQINVSTATRIKHHLCPPGKPVGMGMTGFIVGRTVGFGFYDFAHRKLAIEVGDQVFAQ